MASAVYSAHDISFAQGTLSTASLVFLTFPSLSFPLPPWKLQPQTLQQPVPQMAARTPITPQPHGSTSSTTDPLPPTQTRLFILRHAERLDEANPGGWHSTAQAANLPLYDPPLTSAGIAQANAAATGFLTALHKECAFERIYHSTLLRCVQTAAEAAFVLGLPMTPLRGLAECAAAVRWDYRGVANVGFMPLHMYPTWCGGVNSASDAETDGTRGDSRASSARGRSEPPERAVNKASRGERQAGADTGCSLPALPTTRPPPTIDLMPDCYATIDAPTCTPCIQAVCMRHPGRAVLCCSHREAIRDLVGQGRFSMPYACVGEFLYDHTTAEFALVAVHDAAGLRKGKAWRPK